MPCCTWKCVPTTICSSADPGCHLLQQMSYQWGSQKLSKKFGVSWTHSLPFWFSPLPNSMKWPYYHKHTSQITSNFITLYTFTLPTFQIYFQIWLNVDLFFDQTLLPEIFVLCWTNLDDNKYSLDTHENLWFYYIFRFLK